MIIDTSALMSILYQEDDADYFATALAATSLCRISAANFLEAAIVIDSDGDAEASRQLDHLIRRFEIEITAVTAEHSQIARQAYQDFGKGRHKAKLNYGDCLAYALARETGEELLFKGNDFIHTDIQSYDPAIDDDNSQES